MKNEKAWYLEQRAEALALIYLTRRDDVRVQQQTGDDGYDFLVEIIKDKRATHRVFAIQTKARTEPIKHIRLLGSAYEHWAASVFPLCLFFFAMSNDQAFYTWITEPIITVEGHPKLQRNTEGELKKLDNEALDSIIGQVSQWYDALIKELAA